jgi:hypothetical protein
MWNKIFDALINKLHVAIGTIYAFTLVAYKWCHPSSDLGPGLMNASYAFYAFLGTHAGIYQFRPDKPEDTDGEHKE